MNLFTSDDLELILQVATEAANKMAEIGPDDYARPIYEAIRNIREKKRSAEAAALSWSLAETRERHAKELYKAALDRLLNSLSPASVENPQETADDIRYCLRHT